MFFGQYFLFQNLVHCKTDSYATNMELLKIFCPAFERQENDMTNLKFARKISFPTYFSSTPTWGINN